MADGLTRRLPLLSAVAPGSLLLPLGMLTILLLMVVPVPAPLLDLFFVGNILLSLVMLMLVLQANRPLDFSTFPSVLLVATLLRLALNVASTRLVLVSGHEGPHAAGKVIEAFGRAMIGGDFIVGIIVFVILMIVNLAVIAKGAGRVSEVSARFTLDALPGKQMAIDADLNAGMLTPDEARKRRVEVASEADFYGSMDGASKFVKGDAVAGILILLINIIGGVLIGMFSHGLGLGEAANLYFLLSVGDALVAQIPALMLSIAAAILVTRSAEEANLSAQLRGQFASPAAWWPAAGILGVLSLVPAMPASVLLPVAALAAGIAWRLRARPVAAGAEAPALPSAEPRIDWGEITESAPVLLEIGYGLIPLVDGDGALMNRITGIRRQLSQELGFVLPMVRVRDNLGLAPQAYRITVAGELAGSGEAWPHDVLALEAEAIARDIPGRQVRDPAFGMAARWIEAGLEAEAIAAGYTVVDSSTVIGTHIYKILKDKSYLLFSLDDMQGLIDALGERYPQVSAGLSPKTVPLSLTTSVCQTLLEESVSLKGFHRIAQAISYCVGTVTEPSQLVEAVRSRIGGLILAGLTPVEEPLRVIALSPRLEALLVSAQRMAPLADHPFEPTLGARLTAAIATAAGPAQAEGLPVALISQPGPRRALWRLLHGQTGLCVLAFGELQDSRAVEVIAVVGDELLEPAALPDEHTPEPAMQEVL